MKNPPSFILHDFKIGYDRNGPVPKKWVSIIAIFINPKIEPSRSHDKDIDDHLPLRSWGGAKTYFVVAGGTGREI